MSRHMTKIRIVLAVIGIAALIIGAYAFGSWRATRALNAVQAGQPVKTAQKPDQSMADMPGMKMDDHNAGSTKEADKGMTDMPGMSVANEHVQHNSSATTMPPGTVMLTPQRQQMIGVRTAVVGRQRLRRTLRTVGRIEPDETRIAKVHTKFAGWVEQVFVDFTGKLVNRGEPLFTIYSPELVSTQQEYLISLRGQKYLGESPYPSVADGASSLRSASRERLRLWDISEAQIAELERSGKVSRTLSVSSPITGYVMDRKVYQRVYVTPEMETYTVVDLSNIWVNADIYEYEAPYVHVGQHVSMQLTSLHGRKFTGKITYIYPTLDMNSRTVRVRLEFENPKLELKPNMFADVDLSIDYGEQLVVPAEAVLDSGTRQLVFLARPGGYFEPRELKLGARVEQQYLVLSGLKPGEVVVTSGNFLLDSESRLSTVTGGMAGMKH